MEHKKTSSTKKKVCRKSAKVKHKHTGKGKEHTNDTEEGADDTLNNNNNDEVEEHDTAAKADALSSRRQSVIPSPITGDRKITDDERREIAEAFKVLDEDGDGKLGFEEMKKLLQSQFMTFTDAAANDVIQQLDEDGSGVIEFEEFEKYVIENNLCKPTAEEFNSEMRAAFEMFDSDNNGYIDINEFRALMGGIGDKMSEEEVAEMMKDADTNGDGLIDYREFCVHMSKAF